MLGWFKKKKKHIDDAPKAVAEASIVTDKEVKNKEDIKTLEPQGTGIFGSVSEEPEVTDAIEEEKKDETVELELPSKIDDKYPIEEAQETHQADALKDAPEDVGETSSLFKRLADKLSRTRDTFVNQMDTLFLGKKVIDAELLDDLEELLITSDIGVKTSTELLDYARKKVKRKELSDPAALKQFIKEKLRTFIVDTTKPAELVMPTTGPFVIMVIGVNGVGKTTTIGKIANKFINSGQTVLLAAADTYRAAAVSQLRIWGERNGIEVVSKGEGADPSSVAFDAITQGVEENYDVILVDTAGRLHTQTNLMEELKKIKRVIAKKLDGAPHEVLLVIDATTGQNGISQAKLFDETVGVSGLALTKLDGTAKGGIVANICRDMKIPIRFIGIGEKIEDLRDFDPDQFIEALFQEKSQH